MASAGLDHPPGPPNSMIGDFERLYLQTVDLVIGYFARRCRDPQTIADLTAETFARALNVFATPDPRRGSDRAWLVSIARRTLTHRCDPAARSQDAVPGSSSHRPLEEDEIEELTERIDTERERVGPMRRCELLSADDRAAIELVDLDGLSPKEAALALDVPRVAFRRRLSRARSRLQVESSP